MRIDELQLDPNTINFLKSEGYAELYPPQQDAIKAGILDGESILASVPTASGKTLIAMLATLSHLSKNKSKVIYLTPLRALTSEKYEEFKKLEKISGSKIKVAISTGDFPLTDRELRDADVILLTNETLDIAMTFRKSWVYEIGLVIADEIHLIGDNWRGPTLEMILTQFKTGYLGNKPQIIGLSASISNPSEIAEWLGCKPIESKWRPVPLIEAIYSNHLIMTSKDSQYSEGNLDKKGNARHVNSAVGLGLDVVEDGAQSLIFTMTRGSSVTTATEAGKLVAKQLKKDEREKLIKISETIHPGSSKLLEKLVATVKNGTAFHHAGLDQISRAIIETEFKNGNIKLLTATPTLAAGVNLPARRVIISSVFRFGPDGNTPISILEYKQMCGRAGRPQYDDKGESIIVAKGLPDQYMEHYVNGIPENLESQMVEEHSLRMSLLSVITMSSTFSPVSEERIYEFFSETFAGFCNDKLEDKISKCLSDLNKMDVITGEDTFKPTKFGEKVSWLKIDPATAYEISGFLEDYIKGNKHTFGFLHMITNLREFTPRYGVPHKLREHMETIHDNNKHEKLFVNQRLNDDWTKSLLILYHWINDAERDFLEDEFGAQPGDQNTIRRNAEHLVGVVREIARFWKNQVLTDELDILRQRIRYGVSEKYLDLITIKNVGRKRAKMLYKHGFTDRADLRKASLEELAVIDKIGIILAKSIKSQIKKVE